MAVSPAVRDVVGLFAFAVALAVGLGVCVGPLADGGPARTPVPMSTPVVRAEARSLPEPAPWRLRFFRNGEREVPELESESRHLDLVYLESPGGAAPDGRWFLRADAQMANLQAGAYQFTLEHRGSVTLYAAGREAGKGEAGVSVHRSTFRVVHPGGDLALRIEARDDAGLFEVRWVPEP